MIRAAVAGLGKMGISHCAILKAHPNVELRAACDVSKLVLWVLNKYSGLESFTDYRKMLDKMDIDCVFIATPTKYHAEMIRFAIERGIHVFAEKPFCLSIKDSTELTELARQKNLVSQVGYHNRFIGTFEKAKDLLNRDVIGQPYHIHGEAYGPVVIKPQGETWRSKKSEGGGCLYDYASHVINLMEFLVGAENAVSGTVLQKIYSKHVDDVVYSTFHYANGMSGRLSVNWSDETYRKMSTQITVYGSLGKLIADSQELKVYLTKPNREENLNQGWNISYLTDHTSPVNFFLRGEEYSAQIDHFINCIENRELSNISSFTSALRTDQSIKSLIDDASIREDANG